MRRIRRLDLQAKISLVLVAVIIPTFVIVTIMENQLARPILAEEMRQIGIASAASLGTQIATQNLLTYPHPERAIENRLQQFIYTQPHIIRMDVLVKDPATGGVRILASSVEEDPSIPAPATLKLVEGVTTDYRVDENGAHFWEIHVPFTESRIRNPRILGTVRVEA
jgi:hypothetical protein